MDYISGSVHAKWSQAAYGIKHALKATYVGYIQYLWRYPVQISGYLEIMYHNKMRIQNSDILTVSKYRALL